MMIYFNLLCIDRLETSVKIIGAFFVNQKSVLKVTEVLLRSAAGGPSYVRAICLSTVL